MDELEAFRTNKPDIARLRQQNPELGDLLIGEFKDAPNVYNLPEGVVVSWELLQGKPKNPTYGRIPFGHFEFPTGYTEEVTVLDGTLEAEVAGIKKGTFTRGQIVVAPPNTLLKLDVRELRVYYFCQYK